MLTSGVYTDSNRLVFMNASKSEANDGEQ
jgi:hypothetical protein